MRHRLPLRAVAFVAAACGGTPVVGAADNAPPAVRIVSVTVDGQRSNPSTIHPPGRGNVDIEYAAVEPAPGIRFRYKLEGYTRDWVDVGDRRRAYFTGLPGGKYRFIVEAGRDGVWSGARAEASIHLRPPFYRTRGFYMLAAAALGALLVIAWALSQGPARSR